MGPNSAPPTKHPRQNRSHYVCGEQPIASALLGRHRSGIRDLPRDCQLHAPKPHLAETECRIRDTAAVSTPANTDQVRRPKPPNSRYTCNVRYSTHQSQPKPKEMYRISNFTKRPETPPIVPKGPTNMLRLKSTEVSFNNSVVFPATRAEQLPTSSIYRASAEAATV